MLFFEDTGRINELVLLVNEYGIVLVTCIEHIHFTVGWSFENFDFSLISGGTNTQN